MVVKRSRRLCCAGCDFISPPAILRQHGDHHSARSRTSPEYGSMRRLQTIELCDRRTVHGNRRRLAGHLQEVLLHVSGLYRYGVLPADTAGRAAPVKGDFLHRLQPSRGQSRFSSYVVRTRGLLLRHLSAVQAAVSREIIIGGI